MHGPFRPLIGDGCASVLSLDRVTRDVVTRARQPLIEISVSPGK
jgi:hypothetical protein